MRELYANQAISILYRCGQRYFAQRLRETGLGFELGAMPFLFCSYQSPGITQEALSVQAGMDKGTAARALKKLEAEGNIRRDEDEADGRRRHVCVTEKARALIPNLAAVIEEYHQILYEGFDEAEIRLTRSLLIRMKHNIRQVIREKSGAAVPRRSQTKIRGRPSEKGGLGFIWAI